MAGAKRLSAREWLAIVLADGEAPAKVVCALGRKYGFSRAVLYKALRRMGGRSVTIPGKGRFWALAKPSGYPLKSQPRRGYG